MVRDESQRLHPHINPPAHTPTPPRIQSAVQHTLSAPTTSSVPAAHRRPRQKLANSFPRSFPLSVR
ncbi:hypothetical protein AAT19DRAFT_9985 [Rhodotorula toruloides]|uniref:Uncharacterized protein n=1 Tax=Rhodotorula toruloides TaxID=5286 RepID=A0A2T0A1J4_RHOTO|nr:hypothetical protein AAT19DRAFT_9985 [Rhodotorula toruloides]